MTTIRLHDSMARAKRDFVPLDPNNVRLYLCGPTVYDRAHIGNARAAVVGDVLFRLLRHVYGPEHVTYARNITDIDDKIMARAAETGRSIDAITAETTRWYQDDMKAIGCEEPTEEPRATKYVGDMIAMIAGLVAKGHAYAAEGHVLFSVESYPDYGRLSRRSVADMIAGARVEVAPYKKAPMDFVLWKPSAPDQPGWDSPWGRGRPGWHIECSAMSRRLLGADFDIHAGGADLMFPHHENEIAQSCCAEPEHGFARYWLHNGMVQVDGKKMSKSLGNFFTVQDKLAEGVPGEVIRLALLMTHYRQPLDWTTRIVESAVRALEGWRAVTKDAEAGATDPRVIAALCDDLNFPAAIAALHALRNEIAHKGADPDTLVGSARLLGLLEDELGDWARVPLVDIETNDQFIELMRARGQAREARDFGLADAIRDALSEAGIQIRDNGRGKVSLGFDFEKMIRFYGDLDEQEKKRFFGDITENNSQISVSTLAKGYIRKVLASIKAPSQ